MLRGVGDGLLQARQQRHEPVRGVDARGRGAAEVQPPALARLAEDRPRVGDVLIELARPLDPPLGVLRIATLAHPAGDVREQGAEAVVDDVDLPRRGAVAQRRPDQEVHEQADGDPDHGVDSRCPSMPMSPL